MKLCGPCLPSGVGEDPTCAHITYDHRSCLDARGDPALRVSGGLERLSGTSSWRGCLFPLLLCRRSDHRPRLTPSPPVTRITPASGTRLTLPSLGRWAGYSRLPTVSAQANYDSPSLPPICYPLFSSQARDSLPPSLDRAAAGSAADSVGSGKLTSATL